MHSSRKVMDRREERPGFSLSEVIVGLGIAAVVILTLAALGISTMKANRKSTDTVLGHWVNQREVERLVYDAQSSTTSTVWASPLNSPFLEKHVVSSNIDFHVRVYVTDVDTAAFPAPHQFRKIQSITQWWGGENGGRQGMGQLKAETTSYVHQP